MQNLEVTDSDINGCISDMDHLIMTLSETQGNKIRPDPIFSIISHYASKWLPELLSSGTEPDGPDTARPETVTATWAKKRFFVEALVGILPPEKDCSVPCDFLLRLLRVAKMVRVDPVFVSELEKLVSRQLDRASLRELMIPSFGHTSATLLDVELVLRLVERFLTDTGKGSGGRGPGGGGAADMAKVARLVDSYLAEAAVDPGLGLLEFAALAGVMPGHARSMDDGLYRAIDTYLKAHPGLSKQERKTLCNLMDVTKLSHEASLHAAQNERVPLRTAIHILFSEQAKLGKQYIDWSGSLRIDPTGVFGLEAPARCFSKRELGPSPQIEIKRLKEDVVRLQARCMAMEKHIEKLLEKNKTKKGAYFSWKKIGISGFRAKRDEESDFGGAGMRTPMIVRGCRRKSMG